MSNALIKPGLVSVTFRQLSPREIILLAKETELNAIEWGGDIHVPTGQSDIATEVGRMTREAGLEIEAYGSYYRAGTEDPALPFERVLETAAALGAPRIRIWPGTLASTSMPEEQRGKIVQDIVRCAAMSRNHGITLALEFHANTLTDSAESTLRLMQEIGDDTVRLYWQPPNGMPCDKALEGLQSLLSWIDHVHVFQWEVREGKNVRKPLMEGTAVWRRYLDTLETSHKERWALLEFVPDNDPENLRRDAAALRNWLAKPITQLLGPHI